uniref:Uncharacterized protein n=1 Tax=Monopterus albus TaxID=43700 RepID=A0A3Q3JCZ3_MONAL
MELNAIEKESQKEGEDNKAFVAEVQEQDQIYIDIERASEGDNAQKKTNQHKKSLLEKKIEAFQGYFAEHRDQIHLIIHLGLGAGFAAMVIAACVLNFRQASVLLVISLVTIFFLVWDWMMERYGDRVWVELHPIRDLFNRNCFRIRWILHVLLLGAVVCWLVLDTAQRGKRQLMSFSGLLILVFLMMLFSKHPFRKFMSFADIGSEFVFGASYTDHFFVFKVMPILVFLSSVISILYHFGFMSWLICKIGFIMMVTMGTSPAESMAAAGNIFLGQSEAVLLILPYINGLTRSEIHAVMTGGFASVAGTILGAYISLGVEPTHLLTASVLSAPASLAIAKTFWPETETQSVKASCDFKLGKGECSNALEAMSQGATCAVKVVANIVVNIISILSLVAFLDTVLSWLGAMFGCPQLSFTLICSYVFMPLSFMMGVSWEDSFIVAELIGIKAFLNEFMAYQKLSKLIKRRKAGGPEYVNDVKQYISIHSETIATYALCGFSNLGALGSLVGVMSTMAPDRRSDITSCGLRALIAGSVSCFMTACIAGVLYIPELQCPDFLSTEFNNTSVNISTQLVTCCTQLYNSVTLYEPLNVTIKGGFSWSNLQGCCTLTPPTHFNCSMVL